MGQAAAVIDLEEFRRKKEARPSASAPAPKPWIPVWVWVMVWPAG